ncbi:MAG: phage/plasmid primase, P4 family [Actinomycetota bacterium]|nr:phage/plasmid primase, P4 family [Actinomycetota bacterium]
MKKAERTSPAKSETPISQGGDNLMISNPEQVNTDILEFYGNDGCKLVRLSRATKKCVDADWQINHISLSDLEAWVTSGGNVGMQLGEVSDWRGAVDNDSLESVALASKFLPETLRIAKGSGTPDVYLYRSVGLGFEKFKDLDGETLIDLKASANGKGHQIAVPPSVHPNKGPYRWESGYNPAVIADVEAEELRGIVGRLAVAALIARHLPGTGRHDLAMALAGYMLRNGVTTEDAHKILTTAWEYHRAQQDGLRDLEGIVRDTSARLARNEPATGGRTLEELIPGVPAKIAKFLGWEKTDSRELRRHYGRSDLGNAERFIDMHGDKVRWCPARKSFLVYDGKRWTWDERGCVVKLAHLTARSIHKDAAVEPDPAKQKEIAKFAVASQNEGRISGMLSQVKPYLAVGMGELDSDPWSLNCLNGTLDLRAGRLGSHNPADLITRLAPVEYDPEADCPRFTRFLKETLVDEAVISFIKRYSGYTLTGITRERVFAILYGFGKNGKTTLIELLQDVMGDYATNTDTETILAKKYQGVGNDVAALKGARFVSAAEVERGRRLAESKIKQLTGSDTVTARFLFGEPFNFRPQFKLWLSTNNKPVVQGVDDAIWDRIRLVPFTQRFEGSQADPKLPEKLREELSGVLAWMVEGCLKWQEHGLGEPTSVKAATDQYRAEMDTLATFINEKCVIRRELSVLAERLYQQYGLWCDHSGERKDPQKGFVARLSEKSYERKRATGGVNRGRYIWRGIGLRFDEKPPERDDVGSHCEPSERVGSHRESSLDKPNSAASQTSCEPCEPINQHLPKEKPHVGKNVDLGFTGFTGFTHQEPDATAKPGDTDRVVI